MFKSESNKNKRIGKQIVAISSLVGFLFMIISLFIDSIFDELVATSLLVVLVGSVIGQFYINDGIIEENRKKIKPFDFGDKLYFIEAQEKGRFQLFTGKVYKKREEIITDSYNKEIKTFSYKLKDDKGNITDFINQKLLSSDSNDILSRLSILK